MERYWNEEIETMSREDMKKLQSERLVKQVKHVYENVKYYRDLMDEKGIKPEDIKSTDDLCKLPFLSKADLREAYPYGLLAKPLSECVRIHSTSGTTGKRVVAFYTQNDVDLWQDCCARAITAAGGTKDDICQVCYGYGLFTGGAGLDGGSHKVGCLTLPMSSGNTERQITFMRDLNATILCCTPSYALHLAEVLENTDGVSIDDMKLRVGFFGAEPWTEGMRKELEDKLHIKAMDIYGLTEMSGPGVGGECEYQNGTHLWEDMYYPEIINPDTLEPCEPGEFGELVFTSLTKEAMPILRYRTRDLTRLIYEPCKCGRTAVRMDRILGRSDDMMIIRGVNVFPSQIETCLTEFPAFTPQYFITVDRKNNEDTFDLDVELRTEYFSPNPSKQMPFIKPLYDRIVSMVGIKPNIHIKEPGSIQRSIGKAKHVNDKRVFKN